MQSLASWKNTTAAKGMVTNECAYEARKISRRTPWAHPTRGQAASQPRLLLLRHCPLRLTRKMVQWWYTCRNDSCLHDFLRTINTVSMKSSTCFRRRWNGRSQAGTKARSAAVLRSCPTFEQNG